MPVFRHVFPAWAGTCAAFLLTALTYVSPAHAEEAPSDGPRDFSHGLEFVYLNVEGGFESAGLRTLHTSNLLPETVQSSANGSFFGVGAGLRLLFLTIGPRFRIGQFDAWNLWTLDAEAGIHLPLGRVEPYFTFAGGYAKLGNPDASGFGLADVNIKGFNARAGFGLDIYLAKQFTIGANVSGEILAMSRSGAAPSSPQTQIANCNAEPDPVKKQQCASAAVYAADGSSVGMAGTLAAVMGLHF